MNRTRAPKRGGVVFLLYLSLASGACSDSPTVSVGEPFDPTFAVDAIEAVSNALEASELPAMMSNVNFTFSEARGTSGESGQLPGQGQTYAFSERLLGWEIDPGRNGAPADGVRFVWYAMDTGANAPRRPLLEQGWVDIRMSVTGDAEAVMTVDFVRSAGHTVAEYDIQYYRNPDTGSFSLVAEGSLGVGNESIAFDLNRSFNYEGDVGLYEGIVAFGGPMGSVSASVESPFDPATHLTTDDSPFVGALLTSGHYLLIEAGVDVDENVDGSVEADGREVLRLSGTTLSPSFLFSDGRSPTALVQSDMVEVWEGLWHFMNEGVLLVHVLELQFQ